MSSSNKYIRFKIKSVDQYDIDHIKNERVHYHWYDFKDVKSDVVPEHVKDEIIKNFTTHFYEVKDGDYVYRKVSISWDSKLTDEERDKYLLKHIRYERANSKNDKIDEAMEVLKPVFNTLKELPKDTVMKLSDISSLFDVLNEKENKKATQYGCWIGGSSITIGIIDPSDTGGVRYRTIIPFGKILIDEVD